MRLTQGQFSHLPDLTDTEIAQQIAYAISNGWAVGIEHTDDAHPRNAYWSMWGNPLFDQTKPDLAMEEFRACRNANPQSYIRIVAFDNRKGCESLRMSFLGHRPQNEAALPLTRSSGPGREIVYSSVTPR